MRRREDALTRSLAESEAAFRRQYDRAERAEAEVEALRVQLAAARRDRDLAVNHDRQPYPTVDAYERACAALRKHRDDAERLRLDLTACASILDQLLAPALWGERFTVQPSPFSDRTVRVARGVVEADQIDAWAATFGAIVDRNPGVTDA